MSFSLSSSAPPPQVPAGNIYSASSLINASTINGQPTSAIPIISRPISTTRILLLSGFSPELKTRDILQVFQEWEDMAGGFRVKWVDDRQAYIVFQDALVGTVFKRYSCMVIASHLSTSTAKKAFLATISNMPASLASSIENPEIQPAKLLPYTGPETDTILASVANKPRSRSISQQQPINGALQGRRMSNSTASGQINHHHRRSSLNNSMNGGVRFQNGPPPTSGRNASVGRRESMDLESGRQAAQRSMGMEAGATDGNVTGNMSKDQEEAVEDA